METPWYPKSLRSQLPWQRHQGLLRMLVIQQAGSSSTSYAGRSMTNTLRAGCHQHQWLQEHYASTAFAARQMYTCRWMKDVTACIKSFTHIRFKAFSSRWVPRKDCRQLCTRHAQTPREEKRPFPRPMQRKLVPRQRRGKNGSNLIQQFFQTFAHDIVRAKHLSCRYYCL